MPNRQSIDELRKDIAFDANLLGHNLNFKSTWGLFSPTEIDEGSKLLLEHLEIRIDDQVLDMGCGYGALGIPVAAVARQGKVQMVDKDFVAVEYAKKNASSNGIANCDAYLSNGFGAVPKEKKFSLIISNLPAKVGREFFWILLEDAKNHLTPGGRIYVVTISGLREFVKRNFTEIFGNYDKVKQGKNYTVGMAIKNN